MPVQVSYPGVYVEEIPSGVRTITGVATSITAFIGRARRGPVNEAFTINSFSDFETNFGGLWIDSALGFAVRDFFINGGGQAIIIRLYHPDPGTLPAAAPKEAAPLDVGDLKFVAKDQGKWGVYLRVSVDNDNISQDVATAMNVNKSDLFNLTVRDSASGKSERFLNLTVVPSSRAVDKVLTAGSDLISYSGNPVATALKAFNDKAKD